MKRLFAALILAAGTMAYSQTVPALVFTAPSGNCYPTISGGIPSNQQVFWTGVQYSCASVDATTGIGTWTAIGGSGSFVTLSGDATSTATGGATTVKGINGQLLSALSSCVLYNTTGTGVPSCATAAQVVAAIGATAVQKATDLASYSTLCSGGQFSQGLSSGSNNCATPAGAGTINTASQYAAAYYSASGSATTVSGIASPTVNGVYAFGWNIAGSAAAAPVGFQLTGAGISCTGSPLVCTITGGTGSGIVNSGTATNFTYYSATGTAVGGTPKFVLNADNSVQAANSVLGPLCAAVSASGATAVNLDTANCIIVTATAATTISFTNTNNAGGPWDITLKNGGATTAASWTLPGNASCIPVPTLNGTSQTTHITYDGVNIDCPGSTETPSILRGVERAIVGSVTTAAGQTAAGWDNTNHSFTSCENNAACQNTVAPKSSATSNQWVQYIDATGLQNLAQIAFSNLSGTAQVAQGGTGVTAAQGNGTKVQLSTGTTTTNDCVKFDANGNTVDNGSACGSGGSAPTNRTVTSAPTITAADCGNSITVNDSAAWSVTLPQATGSYAAGTCGPITIYNSSLGGVASFTATTSVFVPQNGATGVAYWFAGLAVATVFTPDANGNWLVQAPQRQLLYVAQADSCLSGPATASQTIGYSGSTVSCVQAEGSYSPFSTGSFTFPANFFSATTTVRVVDQFAVTNSATASLFDFQVQLAGTPVLSINANTLLCGTTSITNASCGQEILLNGTGAPGSSAKVASAAASRAALGNAYLPTWFNASGIATNGTLAMTQQGQYTANTAGNWIDLFKTEIFWESY